MPPDDRSTDERLNDIEARLTALEQAQKPEPGAEAEKPDETETPPEQTADAEREPPEPGSEQD